jgi:hypothetical protein
MSNTSCYCARSTKKPRRELKKVGARNMRMESLLGNPKLVKETLEYVEKTGRFNFEWWFESVINMFGEHMPEGKDRLRAPCARLEIYLDRLLAISTACMREINAD